jgi:hypothetical protein
MGAGACCSSKNTHHAIYGKDKTFLISSEFIDSE